MTDGKKKDLFGKGGSGGEGTAPAAPDAPADEPARDPKYPQFAPGAMDTYRKLYAEHGEPLRQAIGQDTTAPDPYTTEFLEGLAARLNATGDTDEEPYVASRAYSPGDEVQEGGQVLGIAQRFIAAGVVMGNPSSKGPILNETLVADQAPTCPECGQPYGPHEDVDDGCPECGGPVDKEDDDLGDQVAAPAPETPQDAPAEEEGEAPAPEPDDDEDDDQDDETACSCGALTCPKCVDQQIRQDEARDGPPRVMDPTLAYLLAAVYQSEARCLRLRRERRLLDDRLTSEEAHLSGALEALGQFVGTPVAEIRPTDLARFVPDPVEVSAAAGYQDALEDLAFTTKSVAGEALDLARELGPIFVQTLAARKPDAKTGYSAGQVRTIGEAVRRHMDG